MKKIKKVLSILLLIPVMFLFCACGGDPEDPTTPGGGGSQGPEVSLTVSDGFSMSKDLVDYFFESYTEEDNLKMGYDSSVKKSANILKSVNEVIGEYEELYWHKGLAVTVDDPTTEVNCLERFYVDDMSTNDSLNVELIMLFSYDDLDVEYSYKFYCFDVKINKTTKEATIECYYEDSKAQGGSNSTARFECFKISGKVGDKKEISSFNYYTFERNSKIVEPSITTVDNNTIKNFEGCKYLKGQSTIFYLKAQSDANMANYKSVQAEAALDVVSKVVAERNQIGIYMRVLESASGVLVPLVNG